VVEKNPRYFAIQKGNGGSMERVEVKTVRNDWEGKG
jgi:hypothetical protein